MVVLRPARVCRAGGVYPSDDNERQRSGNVPGPVVIWGKDLKTVSIAVGLALLAPTIAHAQSQAPAPDAAAAPTATAAGGTNAAEPGTVVVTANRGPVSIDRVAAAITVLDKDAIDRAIAFLNGCE